MLLKTYVFIEIITFDFFQILYNIDTVNLLFKLRFISDELNVFVSIWNLLMSGIQNRCHISSSRDTRLHTTLVKHVFCISIILYLRNNHWINWHYLPKYISIVIKE